MRIRIGLLIVALIAAVFTGKAMQQGPSSPKEHPVLLSFIGGTSVFDGATERSDARASRSHVRPSTPKLVLQPVVLVKPPKPKPSPKPKLIFTTVYPKGVLQAYALSLLGSAQFSCLAHIVSKEDASWNPLRQSGTGSGAYGIPQALPGSKMASAGSDWRTNGKTQIRWMIGYVNHRYGSACGAWAYWQVHHNY